MIHHERADMGKSDRAMCQYVCQSCGALLVGRETCGWLRQQIQCAICAMLSATTTRYDGAFAPMDTSYFNQGFSAVRYEWGAYGISTLGPDSDVIIIVDVLSFSTCVDVAVGNGALVYPYRSHDQSAQLFATERQALLAQSRWSESTGYSLSPASLRAIPPGTRLVLPSPNGTNLSGATGTIPTIAGCLRNARAV